MGSALRALERARQFAARYQFEMTEDYRELIVRVEGMPRNQSGADKSGRWLGSRADRAAFFDGFSQPEPK